LEHCKLLESLPELPFLAAIEHDLRINKEYTLPSLIGSEMPSWFNNQTVDGSIPVSPFLHDNDNNIICFACCAVFSVAPHYPRVRSSMQRPHGEMTLHFANIHGYPLIYNRFRLPVILNGDLI
jgi:hypothetical protein